MPDFAAERWISCRGAGTAGEAIVLVSALPADYRAAAAAEWGWLTGTIGRWGYRSPADQGGRTVERSTELLGSIPKLWGGVPPRSSRNWTATELKGSLQAHIDEVYRAARSLNRPLVEDRPRSRSREDREARAPPTIVAQLSGVIAIFPRDWVSMAIFPRIGENTRYLMGGGIPVMWMLELEAACWPLIDEFFSGGGTDAYRLPSCGITQGSRTLFMIFLRS